MCQLMSREHCMLSHLSLGDLRKWSDELSLSWLVPVLPVIGPDMSLEQLVADVDLSGQSYSRLGGSACHLYPGICQ